MPRNQTGLGNRLNDLGPEMEASVYYEGTDFCGAANHSSHLKHIFLTPIAIAVPVASHMRAFEEE